MAKSKRAKGKKSAPKTHMMPGGEKMAGKTHEASMKKTMKRPPGRMPPRGMDMEPPAGPSIATPPTGMPVGPSASMPPMGAPLAPGPVPRLPPRRRRVL